MKSYRTSMVGHEDLNNVWIKLQDAFTICKKTGLWIPLERSCYYSEPLVNFNRLLRSILQCPMMKHADIYYNVKGSSVYIYTHVTTLEKLDYDYLALINDYDIGHYSVDTYESENELYKKIILHKPFGFNDECDTISVFSEEDVKE